MTDRDQYEQNYQQLIRMRERGMHSDIHGLNESASQRERSFMGGVKLIPGAIKGSNIFAPAEQTQSSRDEDSLDGVVKHIDQMKIYRQRSDIFNVERDSIYRK
jgi:hypothetical protein